MGQNPMSQAFDRRQAIHEMILLMHRTGLSPPEEEIVIHFESQEYSENETRSE